MDDTGSATGAPSEVPFFQRMFDRPFLLLALGLVIMLCVFTFWGLWEIMNLPMAPLP